MSLLDDSPVGAAPHRNASRHLSPEALAADEPRRAGGIPVDHLGQAAVSAATAVLSVAAVRHVLAWDSLLAPALLAYLVFLATLFVIVHEQEDTEVAVDRLVTTVIWSVGSAVVAVLGWMLGYVATRGVEELRLGFFVEDLSDVGPLNPDAGGAFHSIVGTIQQVGLATAFVVPLAILTAVYLHEVRGRLAPLVRFVVEAMSGLPSIVAGLVVYTIWVRTRDYSGAAAAAALAILMLPTVTRTAEEILRTVPDGLREASLALGAPQWRVIMLIVLPTARAGLFTAAILGVARAIGETAPVILTALGSDTLNLNPFSGAQSSLPLFVWKLYRLPNETQIARAWTGALVLTLVVLVLFFTARRVGGRAERLQKGAR